MWFVVFTICTVGFFVIWWVLKNQEHKNVAKQLEQDAYNQKVKKLNEAKELLRTNHNLMLLHNELVTMYSNEKEYQKDERTKVMVKIVKQTDDLALATAVCALARIEAKKRKERTHVKHF